MITNLVSCDDVEVENPFYLEAVIGEIFSKKEEFVFCICRFEESF